MVPWDASVYRKYYNIQTLVEWAIPLMVLPIPTDYILLNIKLHILSENNCYIK